MLKYLTKFAVDILPSVAATVIGAYIVNHYIVTKPDAPAAASVSTAAAKAAAGSKPADKSTQVSGLPEAGVKAKGMSERTLMERSASERAAVIEKPADPKPDAKSESKPADSPADAASTPAEPRRHQVTPREKAAAKVTLAPAPVAPVAPAAPPAATAPVEATVAPEERRDANDLARAAIERLRGSGDSAPRPQEAARIQEAPRAADAPRVVTAPAIRPLPPPIMVSAPTSDTYDQNTQPKPPYAANADGPRRPTPPAEIPLATRPPLDLHADAAAEPTRERTNIGDEMLSSMKSVFRHPAEVIQSWSKKPLID
jgi:hypothetical protein